VKIISHWRNGSQNVYSNFLIPVVMRCKVCTVLETVSLTLSRGMDICVCFSPLSNSLFIGGICHGLADHADNMWLKYSGK